MKSFDFKDVTLNDGMLKKVLDDTMEFYKKQEFFYKKLICSL